MNCWQLKMYRIFFFLSKIYTLFLKKGFHSFGKGSIIKPPLNSVNRNHIAIGRAVNIGSFSWISVSTEFGSHKSKSKNKVRLKIGNNTDIGNNAFIVANNKVEIGSNVIMGPYVYISDHIHQFENVNKNLHQQPLSEGGFVKIGDNVFIGIKACILPNVTVGERAVIGAGAVVRSNIPPYSVVAGNPAKVVKRYNFQKKKWLKFASGKK